MQPNSILAISPSFSSYSSNRFAEIAAKVIREISLEMEDRHQKPETIFTETSFQAQEKHQNADNAIGESDTDFGVVEDEHDNASELSTQNSTESTENQDSFVRDEESVDGDELEFSFVCQGPDVATITADEIFSNGQIRPIFPIYKHDLIDDDDDDDEERKVMESESNSLRIPLRKLLFASSTDASSSSAASTSSSSESDELEGIPNETYCVWRPKSPPAAAVTPEGCKKSNSTGSSKRWRIRDLMNRSSSDGKDTFVFLSASAVKKGDKLDVVEEKAKSGKTFSGRGKVVSPHEMHYVRNRAIKEGDRRRSYLPYRKDLVGFFANVHGLGKTFHPF